MKKIKNIFFNKEFQQRLWFTVLLLVVYEFGSMITLPGIDSSILREQTGSSSFIQLLDMVGGGSLDRMSLFALGVSPYITASIVIQLMSSDVIPYLTRLRDQGAKGQMKMDRATRILTIALAFVQSCGIVLLLSQGTPAIQGNLLVMKGLLTDSTALGIAKLCLIMTAGSMIAIWFGDLLTLHGLGSGASMIICAGILMRMPAQIAGIYESLAGGGDLKWFLIYMASVLILVVMVVVLQLSERHIPMWDPSARIREVNGEKTNFLPLKVNTPGVMPIIFASSLMIVPMQLLQLTRNEGLVNRAGQFLGLQTWYSVLLYAVLVVLFSFFYARIQIDPQRVSESLLKQGCFIPGIQPGEETQTYISRSLNHIMVFGAVGLMVVAVIPYILPMFSPLTSASAIGGTSILIIIGVLMELNTQVKNLLHKDRYEKFRV